MGLKELKMNLEILLNDFNENVKNLSKLIYNWNLTNSSSNELQQFSIQILNMLYEEKNDEKIKNYIESELCTKYGLFKTEFDAKKLTEEIKNWWNQ